MRVAITICGVLMLCLSAWAGVGDEVFPQDMRTKSFYRVPIDLSLAPEYVWDYSEIKVDKIRTIPASCIVNTLEHIPDSRTEDWYHVEVITDNGHSLGLGYIWLAELVGQVMTEVYPPQRSWSGTMLNYPTAMKAILTEANKSKTTQERRNELCLQAFNLADPKRKYSTKLEADKFLIEVHPTAIWKKLSLEESIALAEEFLAIGSVIVYPYRPSSTGIVVYDENEKDWIGRYPGVPVKGPGYKIDLMGTYWSK